MDELGESELGTQDYWDSRYQLEIGNFESHGDPGEVWFGEDSVGRIITWIINTQTISKTSKIVDIGCGNGIFLIQLNCEGYTNLQGVDYSEGAIKLAKAVAETKGFDVKYWTCDILEGLQGSYDVIHDKGTYDAVSLSAEAKDNRNKYIRSVCDGLNDEGYFIITSCNWTREELDGHFKTHFDCVDVIPTPQFKFGGKIGSVITSLVYKKVK